MFGCQSPKSTHEFLSQGLQLPRNLESGGFYDSFEYQYYVVIKNGQSEYLSGENLKPISISEIPPHGKVIVYVDSSTIWVVLRDLMRDLNKYNINGIHIAFNSDFDCGTAGGATFVIQSTPDSKSGNIYDLVIKSDGSIYDLVSETEYKSSELLIIGSKTEAILIRGTSNTTVSDIIELLDYLSQYPGGRNRCFLNIK